MKSSVTAFLLLVSVAASEFSLADLSAALGSDDECSQDGKSLECALELAQLKVARRHMDAPEAESPEAPASPSKSESEAPDGNVGGIETASSSQEQLSPGTPVRDHWGCHQVRRQDASELPVSTHVAVLIPFREQDPEHGARRKELDNLLANLTEVSRRVANEGVQWQFFIAEQNEKGPFNRGALLNVGFQRAAAFFGESTFTAVTQDCDFIPDNEMVRFYSRSGDGPLHLANYAYCPGFGGVTIFGSDQYRTMNGYSNEMWGWGGEDDDAMDRWMSTPSHIVVAPLGHERFQDIGKQMDGKRDRRHYDKSMTVWNRDVKQQGWVSDGLSSLQYQMLSEVQEADPAVEHVVVEIQNGGL